MPRIPVAVVSSSSSASGDSNDDLFGAFQGDNWTVVNMDSMISIPFSDVSHQPYGMDSTFLDSASNTRSLVLAVPGGGSGSLRATPQGPRTLRTHKSSPAVGQLANFNGLRGAETLQLSSPISTSGAVSKRGLGWSGGPPAPLPAPHRQRRAKLGPQRTRSLTVGAPAWRDSEGDVALLVRREVSKSQAATPTPEGGYESFSMHSSPSSAALSPPELWMRLPRAAAEKGGDRKKNAVPVLPPSSNLAPGSERRASVPAAISPKTASPAAVSPLTPSKNRNPKPSAPSAVDLTVLPRRKTLAAANPSSTTSTSSSASPSGATRRQTVPLLPSTGVTVAASSSPMMASRLPLAPQRRIVAVAGRRPLQLEALTLNGAIAGQTTATITTTCSPTSDLPASLPPVCANGGTTNDSSPPSKASTDRKRTKLLPTASSLISMPTSEEEASDGAAAANTPKRLLTESPTKVRRWQPQRRDSTQYQNTAVGTAHSTADTVPLRPAYQRQSTAKGASQDTISTTSAEEAISNVAVPRRGKSESPEEVQHALPQRLAPVVSASGPAITQRRHTTRRDSTTIPDTLASMASSTDPLLLLGTESPPLGRPETRAFLEQHSAVASYGSFSVSATGAATPFTPSTRSAAERLVSFVRQVSDAEVLHVIYDFLIEHQKATPRYRPAAMACAELLERKEDILAGEWPSTPHVREATGRSGFFTHEVVEDSPYVMAADEGKGEETKETMDLGRSRKGGASVADLLAQTAAEEEEEEGGEKSDTDEFDDANFFSAPYPEPSRFSFGAPTVSGVVSRVFAEGMLYKIKTAEGAYHFYNDTLLDVMMVRVQCTLRGDETVNERAMLAPVPGTSETEITIAVLPEETNFFMSGVSHLPHFLAKRVPIPSDYVSHSVTQSLRKVNAEINIVRKALGKWSRAADQAAYLKCCLKHRLKFTDLTFRPCSENLYRPSCDAVVIPAVTWRRPEEYVYLPEVSNVRLFRGEISCFLVKQGELGNHTVVAAMAAVAQFPAHVRWLFRHPVSAQLGKMERAQGCYRVTLLHNGWWQTLVVDDYVPASLHGPLFAHCAADPRRVWVPLLEKAYAKSLGSYSATCAVDAMEALVDLTGFPARFLDALWAAARAAPTRSINAAAATTNASFLLFDYLLGAVHSGCTVLLYTPASSSEEGESAAAVTLSRKRSAMLLPPGRRVLPRFLPGHIYLLRDLAMYEELGLRMAQLKNPWTWETKRNAPREKRWKYTTWYDRPDVSLSLGSMPVVSPRNHNNTSGAPEKAASPSLTGRPPSPTEQARNERKGTMWVEWTEVLATFAGGGVCYTLWDQHRYRARNAFEQGRPRFALELKARRRVELLLTLTVETVTETLDGYGVVVAARPTVLHGVAMAAIRRLNGSSAHVIAESCDDIENTASARTYVVAREVSMKVSVDPAKGDGSMLIVPLLDPQAAEAMAAAAAAKPGGAAENTATQEVRFVMSLVSDAVAGDKEDLSVSFVSMRRSCGVFTGSDGDFDLEGTARVTTSYQICTERGVVTREGNRILDVEAADAM